MLAFWHPSLILDLSEGRIMILSCFIPCDDLIQMSGVTIVIYFKESFDEMHPVCLVWRCQNMWCLIRAHLSVSMFSGQDYEDR